MTGKGSDPSNVNTAFFALACGVEFRRIVGVWQVESGTTVKGADSVDIGCGNAFGGDDEAVDDSVEKVRPSN